MTAPRLMRVGKHSVLPHETWSGAGNQDRFALFAVVALDLIDPGDSPRLKVMSVQPPPWRSTSTVSPPPNGDTVLIAGSDAVQPATSISLA